MCGLEQELCARDMFSEHASMDADDASEAVHRVFVMTMAWTGGMLMQGGINLTEKIPVGMQAVMQMIPVGMNLPGRLVGSGSNVETIGEMGESRNIVLTTGGR